MKSLLLALVIAAIASGALADQLVQAGPPKEGSFQGFENSRFLFAPNKGRFMRVGANNVTKLILKAPLKVTYLATDGKKEESALLKGFEKSKFTFINPKDRKETILALAKMKKMEVDYEEETEVGGDTRVGRYPIPEVDMTAFGGDMTPQQQSALDRFKDAKKDYDEFVNESTALVREMDKTTGGRREQLLNQLRKRKNEEQPLRKTLTGAYKALVNAFPDQPDEPAKPAKGGDGAKAEVKAAPKEEAPAAEEQDKVVITLEGLASKPPAKSDNGGAKAQNGAKAQTGTPAMDGPPPGVMEERVEVPPKREPAKPRAKPSGDSKAPAKAPPAHPEQPGPVEDKLDLTPL